MYEVVDILVKVVVAKTVPGPVTFIDIVIVVAVPPCMLKDKVHPCSG